MKRFLSVLFALVLISILCGSALAEEYTHPVAGYSFTVPEGWIVIDRVNIEEIIAQRSWDTELEGHVRSYLELAAGPIAYLCEMEIPTPLMYRNNIVITVEEQSAEVDISVILPYTDVFEEHWSASYDNYKRILPMTLIELKPHNAAVIGGRFDLYGMPMQMWSIFLMSGGYMYTFTLSALDEVADAQLDMMGYIVQSFTVQ